MLRGANNRRSGFTLVELLVVITILMILATLAYAVFNANRSSDRMRSAARVAQSAFLGAKDRALHAKDLRGLRLTRDQTDTTLVNGFVYLQPIAPLQYPPGSIQLERHSPTGPQPAGAPDPNNADSADIVYVRGFNPQYLNFPFVDFAAKSQFFASPGRIKIPDTNTGQWYNFVIDTSGPYALSQGNEYLRLMTPYVAGSGIASPAQVPFPIASAGLGCQIQLYNEVMPFHSPISLSSGVVIDLKFSSSSVMFQAGYTPANGQSTPAPLNAPPVVDIMFSPRGMVTGPLAAQGPLHFMLRDLQDATATSGAQFTLPNSANKPVPVGGLIVGPSGMAPTDPNKGDRMILTVFPQTGMVQAFEIDQTDNFPNDPTNNYMSVANPPPAGGPDGLADNVFNFAQQGRSAGR